MKQFVLVGLMLAASGHAQAQRESNVKGTTLMGACTGKSVQACDAYLDGFGDAILAEGKANALACIPPGTTGTELRDVLVKFLKDHPEDQHVKGATTVAHALGKAYPCRK